MTLNVQAQPIPLRQDKDGNWRVGASRVLLELVIDAFNNGRTPEEIMQSYDTLRLEDIYAVITYYLTHRNEVDAYIQRQEQEAAALEAAIKARPDYQEFRERLLARRKSEK
ncbi:MAG: DUF433 domain-containing protein [Chloroflexi bacterium]|nr:DUF433 domain-containing protein [Chloroflexota bacterium]MCI0579684.1 DUF433 domain-containing protein [Chloroflexota bacterium]MCI0649037.1 DUF433 domain-containing protein [Chloroflexota bacterium]MCI0728423.1 DUF433 domain-containing protein [Chloroflexota bacterium]